MTKETINKTAETVSKALPTLAILSIYFFGLNQGYRAGSDVCTRLMAMFSHGNIFHLLGCLFCLWVLKKPLWIGYGLLIAFLATYLPTFTTMPTMGFSGVIFAVIGMEWGRYGRGLGRTLRTVWWLLLIPFVFPQINACYHLWAFAIGYVAGWWTGYIGWAYFRKKGL